MVDTCTIERATGAAPDPLTGVPPRTQVYAGMCKIGGDRPYEQSPEAAGATYTVQRFLLHLPAASGPFFPDDRVTITTSELQPHLVGKVYRVAGPDLRSMQTSQRMYVESY